MIKTFIKRGLCTMLAITTMFSTVAFAMDKHIFIAKKAAVRITNPGEIVECVISAENRNLFAYKVQLVYDKELFELVEAHPVYLQGQPRPLKYMSENIPADLAYNVSNSKVYLKDDVKCGYYGEESIPGMYRSISTIMGFDGRADGDIILKITLKSKKAGDGFIYLTDEETSVLNEDKTVSANTVKTTFSVKTEDFENGFIDIHNPNDIAYPWRKSETIILQQTNESQNGGEQEFTGVNYDVSYANSNAEFKVLEDGTVICSIPMQKDAFYTPVVARVPAFGEPERVNRIRYDASAQKLIFIVENFGDYIIADKEYQILDCTKGSEEYNAVSFLKSIGAVDEQIVNFEPNRNITKAEFLKMLVCCLGGADTTALVWFKDVSLSDWHYKYIATAAKKGIIVDDGGSFYPDNALDGAEAKVMLQKVSDNINGEVLVEFDNIGNITRGEAAVAIQKMLCIKLR